MKILVTGGCGYKGSVLIPKLIKSGHSVLNFDPAWFGNNLNNYQELTFIKGDIRDTQSIPLQGVDVVVH